MERIGELPVLNRLNQVFLSNVAPIAAWQQAKSNFCTAISYDWRERDGEPFQRGKLVFDPPYLLEGGMHYGVRYMDDPEKAAIWSMVPHPELADEWAWDREAERAVQ